MKKLKVDYEKMIDDILPMVDDDFTFDIDCMSMHPERDFTQEQAKEMAKRIMKIFWIAHQVYCSAHGKYKIKERKK